MLKREYLRVLGFVEGGGGSDVCINLVVDWETEICRDRD